MIRLLIVASFLVCGLGATPILSHPGMDARIVLGFPANIEDFPYQVLVQFVGRPHCGATIISEVYAVTAAHCVHQLPPTEFTVRAGSSRSDTGGTLHQVTEIIENAFNESTADYDIAILKVEPPFTFSDKVKPILLANSTPAPGTSSIVSGWGTTHFGSTKILQQVSVYVVDHEKCNAIYLEGFGGVTARMMCAGSSINGQGSCQGDSGGPLVAAGQLVGVVSWAKGCGLANFPGVYADVAVFRGWIRLYTGV